MTYIKFTILIWMLVMASCASTLNFMVLNKFDKASKSYTTAIRWADFEVANSYLKQTQNQERSFNWADIMKTSRITDCKVRNTIPLEGNVRIRQEVVISYYKTDNPSEKILTDHQVWEFDQDAKRWYLVSDLPDFK